MRWPSTTHGKGLSGLTDKALTKHWQSADEVPTEQNPRMGGETLNTPSHTGLGNCLKQRRGKPQQFPKRVPRCGRVTRQGVKGRKHKRAKSSTTREGETGKLDSVWSQTCRKSLYTFVGRLECFKATLKTCTGTPILSRCLALCQWPCSLQVRKAAHWLCRRRFCCRQIDPRLNRALSLWAGKGLQEELSWKWWDWGVDGWMEDWMTVWPDLIGWGVPVFWRASFRCQINGLIVLITDQSPLRSIWWVAHSVGCIGPLLR